jgi:hypothetical protein
MALCIVFLQEVVPVLIEDVSLALYRDMWFQHQPSTMEDLVTKLHAAMQPLMHTFYNT